VTLAEAIFEAVRRATALSLADDDERAALTMVANVLLSMDATLTRE